MASCSPYPSVSRPGCAPLPDEPFVRTNPYLPTSTEAPALWAGLAAPVETLALPGIDAAGPEDEWAVLTRLSVTPLPADLVPAAVPEPAAALLLTLVCLAALWRARC